ncbi:MAG TPA: SDR family NAD(P)-dependent oxidoreductase [Casimicrobiaceae bacterium]|nr:SDR family NAD(P)-dependent oxidoreductase [Casimicrobiaceae bacterium]
MDFRARHVIVTGGTGALGSAVVGRLVAAGAQCHVPYTDARKLDSFEHRDRVHLVPCDLTDQGSVAKLYEDVPQLWASIHLAGGFEMAPAVDTDKAALQRMLDTNLVTCFLCCRFAARRLGTTEGRIVNVAARAALEPRSGAGMTAYVASKAAVAALTQALAAELVGANILVNAVAPSVINTAANREAMPNARQERWPTPDEIAAAILFLASPENAVTSGAVVPVYGQA